MISLRPRRMAFTVGAGDIGGRDAGLAGPWLAASVFDAMRVEVGGRSARRDEQNVDAELAQFCPSDSVKPCRANLLAQYSLERGRRDGPGSSRR